MTQLEGAGVHVLNLHTPDAGSLLVAAAESGASTVVALEREAATGWTTVAIGTGIAPVVAVPTDGAPAAWRVEAWTVDGGGEPIRLAARAISAATQTGKAALAAVDGMPVFVGHAALPAPGLASVTGGPRGLRVGGLPGLALSPVAATMAVPGTDLWLVAPTGGGVTVEPLPFTPGQDATVQLPPGLALPLPAAPDGTLAVWRATSGAGHPTMGMASSLGGSATVALATGPVSVRGAERLSLVRFEPKLLPGVTATNALRTTLPAGAALPVTLPDGDKSLQVDLGPGVSAFAGWHDKSPLAVDAGRGGVTETMQGAWTDLLLVNTGSTPLPASVTVQPAAPAAPLKPGAVLKRFFGAAGSFALEFEAPPGAHLATAGAVLTTATITGSGGSERGRVGGGTRLDRARRWPSCSVAGRPRHDSLAGPAAAGRDPAGPDSALGGGGGLPIRRRRPRIAACHHDRAGACRVAAGGAERCAGLVRGRR